MVDLSGRRRPVNPGRLRAMSGAIIHRGPDEEGFLFEPGIGFANRRLSIVGLADGQQPVRSEDGLVQAVFNGEFYDYPELKQELQARGHIFKSHCDTELIPHLWEDHADRLVDRLRGQFAFAVHDSRANRVVIARDRFGICPLYWTVAEEDAAKWLIFGSEIKAILASGLVKARPDREGISSFFSFFGVPGPRTCFEGIHALRPGQLLDIFLTPGRDAVWQRRSYFDMDFPDRGDEVRAPLGELVDRFEKVLYGAVERRLRADVPVVSYLSGGVDSGIVVAMASKALGRPIPSFTIRITDPHLDETDRAMETANKIGCKPFVVDFGPGEALNTYPELIEAAESPVIDTSCAALLMLSRAVHQQGYKVALTGEGSDEWMAGYPWHKTFRVTSFIDRLTGLPFSTAIRDLFVSMAPGRKFPASMARRVRESVGGYNGWLDIYGIVGMS
jgi:asparagine synthase (glutamine-hydrolysing)